MDNHGYDDYESEDSYTNYGYESDNEEDDDHHCWDSQGSAKIQNRQNSLNPYRYFDLIYHI